MRIMVDRSRSSCRPAAPAGYRASVKHGADADQPGRRWFGRGDHDADPPDVDDELDHAFKEMVFHPSPPQAAAAVDSETAADGGAESDPPVPGESTLANELSALRAERDAVYALLAADRQHWAAEQELRQAEQDAARRRLDEMADELSAARLQADDARTALAIARAETDTSRAALKRAEALLDELRSQGHAVVRNGRLPGRE